MDFTGATRRIHGLCAPCFPAVFHKFVLVSQEGFVMTVTFSRHALERLEQRFSGTTRRLVQIIEAELTNPRNIPLSGSRRVVEGRIGTQPVRVVLDENARDVFTVVTAMWL